MMSAIRPFSTMEVLPCDVVGKLIAGMDTRLLTKFKRHYPNYGAINSLRGADRRGLFPQVLKGMTDAELEVQDMQNIAINAVGQSFHMAAVGAYPSQPKNTLNQ